MVLCSLVTVFLSGCGNSTSSSFSATSAPADDRPAGLQSAAISWAHAFLTGSAVDIYKMEGTECRTNTNPNSSAATSYLRGMRVQMERYLGEPLASIKVTGVQVRNFSATSGEAEVQFDLPANKIGNDNWVTYGYEDGQWKVSNCHAPIGSESSSSSSGSALVP